MKRNDLLAKSLTLGLAVATAAASMSVPALAGPQVVKAADGTEQPEQNENGEASEKDNDEPEKKALTVTLKKGEDAITDSTELRVGDEITAEAVAAAEAEEVSALGEGEVTYKYEWYRVKDDENAKIDGAETATYTLTAGDVGCKIKVVATSSEDESAAAGEATTAVEVKKKKFSGVTLKFGEYKDGLFPFTVAEGTVAEVSELEYSLDSGKTWTKGDENVLVKKEDDTGFVLTLDGKTSYEANTIQIRVAATDEMEAGEAVKYNEAIKAKLAGTVKISGTVEYGVELTVDTTDVPDNADLQYQWYREADEASAEKTETEVALDDEEDAGWEEISGATNKGYVIGKEDVGKKLKVVVSATNYEGEISATTETKVAKKTISLVTKKLGVAEFSGHDFKNMTIGCTISPIDLGVDGSTLDGDVAVKYACVEKGGTLGDDTTWQESNDFKGLTPGATYTFYAKCELTEDGEKCLDLTGNTQIGNDITMDKLTLKEFDIAVETEAGENSGKTVTITASGETSDVPLVYSFDGGKNWSEKDAEDGNKHTFSSDELAAGGEITVAAKYAIDDENVEKFTSIPETSYTFDVTKDTQKAPTGLTLTTVVSEDLASYTITAEASLAEGVSDVEVEYSLDGTTWGEKNEFTGVGAFKAVTVYARVKGTESANPSTVVSKSITTPAATAEPKITAEAVDGDTTKRTITITGGDSATIYYTTDGSEPTKDSQTYSEPFTVEKTKTIKAFAVQSEKVKSTTVSLAGESGGGSSSGGGAGGGSSAGVGGGSSAGGGSASTDTSNKTDSSKTETKPDGSTVKTETTTNNDGSTTTKTETTNKDGSTETKTETTNKDGSTETKTETTNKDGSTETKTEVKNTDGSTESKTEVKKADGSTESKTEVKKTDGSTESKTEVKKTDGSTKTTTEVKNADGSSEKKTETVKADGSSTSKTVIKEEGTKVVVNASKDADGTTTTAKANVQIVSEDNSAGISAEMVDKLTAEAGTKDVTISQRIFNTEGKTICKVNAKASDLKAGKKLKVFKIDSETGELTLVNNATYKVDKKGNVSFDGLQKANYQVMTATEANKYAKQVLKTVKAAESKKTVTEGKQTKMKLDSGLNMKNVKKITYKTNKKSVATVDKSGKITTKKSGKVNVTATVTLKNGKKKNVTMTITVKADR